MEQSRTSQTRGGVGFLGLLALLFIGLKLTGYIAWSWWWVLAPLWVPLGVVIVLFLVFLFVVIGAVIRDKYKRRG